MRTCARAPRPLDRLKPQAKVAGSDKALKLDKQATFFAVAGPLAKDDSIVADATPGKLGEETYDSVRCASTLFVRVADGLQGPSQPAVTMPKRY